MLQTCKESTKTGIMKPNRVGILKKGIVNSLINKYKSRNTTEIFSIRIVDGRIGLILN
jgi:hypothetical protein